VDGREWAAGSWYEGCARLGGRSKPILGVYRPPSSPNSNLSTGLVRDSGSGVSPAPLRLPQGETPCTPFGGYPAPGRRGFPPPPRGWEKGPFAGNPRKSPKMGVLGVFGENRGFSGSGALPGPGAGETPPGYRGAPPRGVDVKPRTRGGPGPVPGPSQGPGWPGAPPEPPGGLREPSGAPQGAWEPSGTPSPGGDPLHPLRGLPRAWAARIPTPAPPGYRGAPARGVDVKPLPGRGSGRPQGAEKPPKTSKLPKMGIFGCF